MVQGSGFKFRSFLGFGSGAVLSLGFLDLLGFGSVLEGRS